MFKLNKILPSTSKGLSSNPLSKSNSLDNAPVTTVIGADVEIMGNLTSENNIKIDGKIKGDLHVKNSVVLGDKSLISGNIQSKNIIVYGRVEGNISCTQLTLKNTGNVNGDISTQTIEIEIGGKYNGRLSMEGAKQP